MRQRMKFICVDFMFFMRNPINCRMKFDKRKKNLLPDFFFIYGEKKKACKSEKQALARLFYFRKGCEHSGKKKDKETPV